MLIRLVMLYFNNKLEGTDVKDEEFWEVTVTIQVLILQISFTHKGQKRDSLYWSTS